VCDSSRDEPFCTVLPELETAESLPVTGQVDTRTAAELGVRPESNWDNFQSAGRQDGHSSDIVVGDTKKRKTFSRH